MNEHEIITKWLMAYLVAWHFDIEPKIHTV